MNITSKAAVQSMPQHDTQIPTLEVPHQPDNSDIRLDTLVGQMADELQAIYQQHLYQIMVKTLHEVIRNEGKKMSDKILNKLQQQLPEIIEAACQGQEHRQTG